MEGLFAVLFTVHLCQGGLLWEPCSVPESGGSPLEAGRGFRATEQDVLNWGWQWHLEHTLSEDFYGFQYISSPIAHSYRSTVDTSSFVYDSKIGQLYISVWIILDYLGAFCYPCASAMRSIVIVSHRMTYYDVLFAPLRYDFSERGGGEVKLISNLPL